MGDDEILLSNVKECPMFLTYSSNKHCFKEINKYFETLKTESVGHAGLSL